MFPVFSLKQELIAKIGRSMQTQQKSTVTKIQILLCMFNILQNVKSGGEAMIDVAVIGAGLAGLSCAQRLQQSGFRVVVLEKSKGLGGRLATRRLLETHADHGVRCLEEQGKLTQTLIQTLREQGVLHPWTNTIHEWAESKLLQPGAGNHSRYAASNGITAVAKFLANGLEIWRSQRVQMLMPQIDRTWALRLEPNQVDAKPTLTARAVVVMIPAPQALSLLEPLEEHGLSGEFLSKLRSVRFAPCLTTIASYPAAQQAHARTLPWQAISFPDNPDVTWLAIDSTKQPNPQFPTIVLHSTATFAQTHLEEQNLLPLGQQLLNRVAAQLSQPWLTVAAQLQVHRWRYAFVSQPLSETQLSTSVPLPLGCGGDWCGGNTIEAALYSGIQCAEQIAKHLT